MKTYIHYDESNATPDQPYTITYWTAEQFKDWQHGGGGWGWALITGGDISCAARTRTRYAGRAAIKKIESRVTLWMASQPESQPKPKKERKRRAKVN